MSDRRHLKTCGTSYRGCDPQCPSRLAGEAEERSDARASLTPSEVALAKILAAWDDWKGERGPDDVFAAVCEIHDALARGAWTDLACLTDKGRALLDRARRAGVL